MKISPFVILPCLLSLTLTGCSRLKHRSPADRGWTTTKTGADWDGGPVAKDVKLHFHVGYWTVPVSDIITLTAGEGAAEAAQRHRSSCFARGNNPTCHTNTGLKVWYNDDKLEMSVTEHVEGEEPKLHPLTPGTSVPLICGLRVTMIRGTP